MRTDFLPGLEDEGLDIEDIEGKERAVLRRVLEMSRDSSSLSVIVQVTGPLKVQKFAENLPFQVGGSDLPRDSRHCRSSIFSAIGAAGCFVKLRIDKLA